MVNTALILAGGLGTRLRSTVPGVPKPMAPIEGRPFLEYQLDYWIEQGITRFVLAIGYRHEIITSHFAGGYKGAAVDFVIEKTPLGTGGALLLAIDEECLKEPFLLLNGDTYFAVSLDALTRFAEARDADWCFSLVRTTEAGRYLGMQVADDGGIVSLASQANRSGVLVNGGVYRVHPRNLGQDAFLRGGKISLEDDILPAALASGRRLFGMEFSGAFIDIGVPHDYDRAAAVLAV